MVRLILFAQNLIQALIDHFLSNDASHLLLSGVEGKIPNIQSVALLQQLFLFVAITLKNTSSHHRQEQLQLLSDDLIW